MSPSSIAAASASKSVAQFCKCVDMKIYFAPLFYFGGY